MSLLASMNRLSARRDGGRSLLSIVVVALALVGPAIFGASLVLDATGVKRDVTRQITLGIYEEVKADAVVGSSSYLLH